MYISEWRFGDEICSSLTLYREIKCTFDRADYQVLENRKFRKVKAKSRLSSHKLFVETGDRYRDKTEHAFSVILIM